MKTNRFWFLFFASVMAVLLAVGTAGFVLIEKFSPLNAFYFTIATVATVGYGDIAPQTAAGKIFSILLIICGVGTFLGVVATATEVLMEKREEKLRIQKLHVVTGLFFTEAGTRLLSLLAGFDPGRAAIQKEAADIQKWKDGDYANKKKKIAAAIQHQLNASLGNLEELKAFVSKSGELMLRLMENPNLHEYESFTELLRAAVHLRDELVLRPEFASLPESDLAHIAGDMKRVYVLLVAAWLDYMQYLRAHYPYLFSLAVRLNPFDPEASIIVSQ